MKIDIYGQIVSDEDVWIYQFFDIPHCSPKQVRDAIAALAQDEELVLEINSPGGDVWAGFEIFGLLQACKAHTEAHIIAKAASAATTVCSACDTVLASPVAQFMIHQPATYVYGSMNNRTAGQLKNFLDSVKASIINGYVVKSGGKASRKKLEQLVDQQTWMPVQDAIELGLVDGMLDTDDATEAAVAASGGVALQNAVGSPLTPSSLLERYEAAVRAGTMEAVPGHPVSPAPAADAGKRASGDPETSTLGDAAQAQSNDWQLQARINLERVRTV